MLKSDNTMDSETIPFTGPAWFDQALRWLKAHERAVFGATVGFQVAVLGAMIALNALPLLTGETIRLKVEPVDPRDLMRGDYVILSYQISQVSKDGIEGIPDAQRVTWRRWDRDEWLEERTVYVTLEPDADGKLWHGTKVSVNKPAAGKFIRGKFSREWGQPRIKFGIEAFYVQEGHGKRYEEARNKHHLVAEIALTAAGKSALRGLTVE